ncbi:MAG: twin-arginine translocase subunit TatC [Acidobacteriota bacterium]|jgi:sec-independent protein translocase protein TatC|nr:twin-arginine translocase subunit TatC [Acidobacteriota bacterium]
MALVPFPGAAAPDDGDPHIHLTDPDVFDDAGAKMSFLDHLDELRKRLINCLIALVVGCVISFIFINRTFEFVMLPLYQMLPPGGSLIFTQGSEAFILYVKVGGLVGLILAIPLILIQVWLFIAPGLYSNEKKFAIPFVVFSTVFFLVGALFSHYVAFPWTWKFFIGFQTPYMTFMPKISEAFSLYVTMLLGFGLIFQMPTLVLFLARMGVVSARFLIQHTKYAVLIIFIIAAVISPGTDPMSQVLMAGPMMGLYGISILVAWMFGKRKPA